MKTLHLHTGSLIVTLWAAGTNCALAQSARLSGAAAHGAVLIAAPYSAIDVTALSSKSFLSIATTTPLAASGLRMQAEPQVAKSAVEDQQSVEASASSSGDHPSPLALASLLLAGAIAMRRLGG